LVGRPVPALGLTPGAPGFVQHLAGDTVVGTEDALAADESGDGRRQVLELADDHLRRFR
jgi:hypothetical protein